MKSWSPGQQGIFKETHRRTPRTCGTNIFRCDSLNSRTVCSIWSIWKGCWLLWKQKTYSQKRQKLDCEQGNSEGSSDCEVSLEGLFSGSASVAALFSGAASDSFGSCVPSESAAERTSPFSVEQRAASSGTELDTESVVAEPAVSSATVI